MHDVTRNVDEVAWNGLVQPCLGNAPDVDVILAQDCLQLVHLVHHATS